MHELATNNAATREDLDQLFLTAPGAANPPDRSRSDVGPQLTGLKGRGRVRPRSMASPGPSLIMKPVVKQSLSTDPDCRLAAHVAPGIDRSPYARPVINSSC